MSDERLAKVEERISGVSADVADLKEAINGIAEVLRMLAVLEERHRGTDEAIKRAFSGVEKIGIRIDKLVERVEKIEVQMPNLSLASSWVFRAVLVVMSLTGITYIVTLIKSVGK